MILKGEGQVKNKIMFSYLKWLNSAGAVQNQQYMRWNDVLWHFIIAYTAEFNQVFVSREI